MLKVFLLIVVSGSAVTGQYCLDQVDNSEFDNGTASWGYYINSGSVSGTASLDNTSQLSGVNSFESVVTAISTEQWHIQLVQEGRSLVNGQQYRFSFSAKADATRDITAAIDSGAPSYTSYSYNPTTLTTSAQSFAYTFTASASQANGVRVIFNLAQATGTVWIDNVKLEELSNACYAPANDVILQCNGTVSPTTYDLPDAAGGSTWSILYSPSGANPAIGASSGTISNMTHAGQYIAVLTGGADTDTVEIAVPACDLPCIDDGGTAVGYVDWTPLGAAAINGPTTNTFTVTLPGHTDIDVTQTMVSGITKMTNGFTTTNKPAFLMLGHTGGTNENMYLETGTNDTQIVEFDFDQPIADFDFLIYDIDQYDQVVITATDASNNPITDLSNWIVTSSGDATMWESGGSNSVIAPPPTINLATGTITSSDINNFNRSFVALRPDQLLNSITIEYTSSVGGNHVYFDFYATLLAQSNDCLPGCLLSNPDPGFPMDFLNNNTGWIDYDLGNDLKLIPNGDGTITISGSITDGTPVDFGSGVNGSSCGVNDGWDVTLTLFDKQNWSTFQAAGGSANVHANCNADVASLDYWDVTGTLIGTGCNASRTLTINGPTAPYRFQIGKGGNSADATCSFGMSTWFDMVEGANPIPSDIYAFIEQSCYEICVPPSIDNITVGSCIDHPLRDVATVSVQVSWTSAPSGQDIEVQIGDKIEIIDVSGFATSPTTIEFMVPADGSTNNQVIARWSDETGCEDTDVFDVPSACSSDEISCNILYLCGLDKPYDGDAWDHGWIEYLNEVNGSNTITPILTKDEAGLGTYDVMNQNTFVNVDLESYGLIIISATTEGHISADLVEVLKDISVTVLNSNYDIVDDLGLSQYGGGVKWGADAYTDNSTNEVILNYDNPTSWAGTLFTTAVPRSTADGYLWANAGDQAANNNGIVYYYGVNDSITGVTSSHGARLFLGYHFNGIYANSENNGLLPSPPSSWFSPINHLTLEGKRIFDAALVLASGGCTPEICNNNIDDDGDGSIDSDDPDCFDCQEGVLWNPGFDNGMNAWGDFGNTSVVVEANGNKFIKISGGPGGLGQQVSVAEGDSIVLTFFAKKSGIVSFEAGIAFYDLSYNQVGAEINVVVDTDVFSQYQVTYVVPANIAYVKATAYKDDIQGEAYVDGFCLLISSDPGIIAGDEIQCSSYNPSEILSYEDPETGTGFTYAWEVSSDGSTWATIAGATAFTYDPPAITSTRYYRRVVFDDQSNATYSNVVAKEIDPTLIICPDQSGWDFDCDNPTSIGMAGSGIKGQSKAGTRVLNASFMDYYIVRATFEGGVGSPESVIFTTLEGESKAVNFKYLDGESGVAGKRYFEAVMTPSDSIFVEHTGDVNTGESIVVNTVQSVPFSANPRKTNSVGSFVNEVINPGEVHTTTVALPAVLDQRDVYVSLPLSSIANDGSEVYVEVSVGNISQIDTITTFTNGNSLELVYINLYDVTFEASTLTIKVTSPATNGQTVLLSGTISTVITCDDRLVILAEGDLACPSVGDTIAYTYTLHNFADFPIFYLNANSSLTGSIDFGQDSIAANSQLVTVVDYIIQLSDVPELVNYVTASGFNFPANGIKGIADNVTDSLALCEDCINGVDDDGDGMTDCLDPDCDAVSTADVTVVDPSICEGSSTQLVVNANGGPAFITWALGDTQTVASTPAYKTITPTGNTTYVVTVTTSAECDATGSVAVSVASSSLLAIINTPLSITCDNSSVDLVANPNNLSYLWSNGSTSRTNSVSDPGIYTVTVTDANGCTDDVEVHVVDNTGGPVVSLENVETCGPPVELVPEVCEQYGDIIAKRNLQRINWNNQLGETGSALVGDGELCFTVDSLFNSTPQMLGLSDNPGISRSHTNLDYAIYIRPRLQINQYLVYIYESGANRGIVYNGASFVGSEFCVRRTGTLVEYFKDGVLLYTSAVASTQDLYFDNSFHSATSGTWADSYSAFTDISLCGELDMAGYQWSTNETTPTITTGTLGNYTVTVTDAFGCTSSASAVVSSTISDLAASIDYNGNVCADANSIISGVATGGTAGYMYNWTGPNSFTGNTPDISIADNGNYYLTITDSQGCTATTSGFVYQQYEPTIINLQTQVCEGESVTLNVNSSNATSYQWSANAGASTGPNVTVTPSSPASTYYVTVTNNLGCQGVAQATISADPQPLTTATSDVVVCQGEVVSLSTSTPTSGTGPYLYAWNNGLGTGQSKTFTAVGNTAANTTQTYTVQVTDDNGCQSSDEVHVTILSSPTVTYTKTDEVCEGDDGSITFTITDHATRTNMMLSINGGTNWTQVADNSSTYTFANLAPGTYSLATKWTNDECENTVGTVTIAEDNIPVAEITGSANICVGSSTTLTPSTGGFWTSNNNSVATITNSGVVTGIATGTVNFTFTTAANACASLPSATVTVDNGGSLSISGDGIMCEGTTTTLTASSGGGTWSSSNTNIATISSAGVVTAQAAGTVTITYAHNSSACTADATHALTIDPQPTTTMTGDTIVCIGEQTTITPSTGGTWTSSDNGIASISNTGIINSISAGTVTFTFTSSGSGCTSDASQVVEVTEKPTVAIDFNGSPCLNDSSKLGVTYSGGTAPFSFSWSGPNSFVATTEEIDISENGSYYVTITDAKGCSANTSGYIYQEFQAFVINLQTDVCEGESVNLTASGTGGSSYLWSSNAADSTNPTVTVTPVFPASTYQVTITNNVGCQAVAEATVDVDASPTVSLLGPGVICQGENTNLSPSSGGIWTSNTPSVATVNFSGQVTGISAGTASFTFTDINNGCESLSPINVQVNARPTVSFAGATQVCVGDQSQLAWTGTGTWTSQNPSIATVDQSGLITAVASGIVDFTFTDQNTNCSSTTTQKLIVNQVPTVVLDTNTPLCVGEVKNAFPSVGGLWSSSNPAVATITNTGLITAVGPGKAIFTYVNILTGCSSNPTDSIVIGNVPVVSITGSATVCLDGTTTLSPALGGTWSSSNSNIASVSNFGIVTGNAPGTATFQYTDGTTGCISEYSSEVTVLSGPIISISGDNNICVGDSTQLNPSTGGTWVSNGPQIASVTPNGKVFGLAGGSVTFTFTQAVTGCTSTTANPVTVYNTPDIVLNGPTEICVGTSTNLQPSTGGIWTSSDNSKATISNSGNVTGISPGTVTFTYTETLSGCASEESLSISILPAPIATITGPNALCIGDNTTLSPSTGGSWLSNNPSVATVTPGGIVTAHSQGATRFIFVSDAGCTSNQTPPVIVYGKPSVFLNGATQVCIGNTLSISPTTGGTWISTNPSVASITNSGLITGLMQGTAAFIYTDAITGCSSNASEIVSVQNIPESNINGPSDICIGGTTNVSPTVGGAWASSNIAVATINNQGTVTGVGPGSVTFTFTSLTTGCVSLPTDTIVVEAGTPVSYQGPTSLCIGDNTQLSPSTGGTWMSTNPLVATITNAGLVTALNQGTTRFRYTNSATGCASALSAPLTVHGIPSVAFAGDDNICIGGNGQLSPSIGGTWVSSDTNIATVTNTGLITGIAAGSVSFTYTDASTGCSSDGSLTGQVVPAQVVSILGDNAICIGGHTSLSPSTGGTWASSNPKIATVNNSGIVKGLAAGEVTFTFTSSTTGCASGSTTDPVSVSKCVNHDFNVTTVDMQISSSIATNDIVPAGTSYQSAFTLVSKPLSSTAQLTIAADGTYTFTANTAGKYLYNVPVCIPPSTYGCTRSILEITVIGSIFSSSNVVSNLDMASTYANADPLLVGTPVSVHSAANDHCVSAEGCNLDLSSASLVGLANHGAATINGSAISTYVPEAGYVGKDTIYYELCPSGNSGPCSTTMQIIEVMDASAGNSVYAVDDFTWGMKDIEISQNLLTNDGDAEGDGYQAVAQGTQANPIVGTDGSYYIQSNGTFVFTPADGFVGYTEVIYTVCDDNTDQACTDATVHILVFDDLTMRLKVYLEGALINNANAKSSSGIPLMRDGLRSSVYDGLNYIPSRDPYTYPASVILDFTSQYTHVGPGLDVRHQIMHDSTNVLSVSGQNAIVDWVFVELRSKNNMLQTLGTRSGLLQRDGDIVDLDGTSPLRFQGVNSDSCYVVVKHRSHLAVMSGLVATKDLVDFTSTETEVFNFGTTKNNGVDYSGLSQNTSIKPGYQALWAGDFNSDGKIKYVNPDDDINWLFFNVLLVPENTAGNINYDFAYGYYNGDYNMDAKAKFTNPDDDTNLLFFQILLYGPNSGFIANYDFFIEQVPR